MVTGHEPGRVYALDRLRGGVIVLVVLHHAVLAYCTFGHIDRAHYAWSTAPIVDAQRWVGFDVLVLLNDGFFMPLLFLLSGLFVWSSLVRKRPVRFVASRLRRLGLPFAVAALTLMPLAYYPSFLEAGGTAGFVAYWTATVTDGPWPSGPPWFLAVLLALDLVAAAVFARVPRPVRGGTVPPSPAVCCAVLIAASVLASLPLVAAFGPGRWLSVGPFAVQASRAGLYAVYFGAGTAFGALFTGQFRPTAQRMARHWAGWGAFAVLTGAVYVGVAAWRIHAGVALPPWVGDGVLGCARVLFSAAAGFAMMALSLRFGDRRSGLADSLVANAFGLYLLHYPVVTWLQFALLDVPAAAGAKAACVFTAALVATRGASMALRRVPGLRRPM